MEFNELQLQTIDQGTSLVYTQAKQYTYKWSDSLWTIEILNSEQALVDPSNFLLPITVPNTWHQEEDYQNKLSEILSHPTDFDIDSQYWGSVDSTEVGTDEVPGLTSRASTPESEYRRSQALDNASPAQPPDDCLCGIDVCLCDKYRPRTPQTPPTPPYIILYCPFPGTQPVPGVHLQQHLAASIQSG